MLSGGASDFPIHENCRNTCQLTAASFYWFPFCLIAIISCGMMALAEIALDLLFSVFLDVFLIWTGELLLCAFTLGKRKPAFRFWRKEPRSRLPDLLSFNALVGLLFWTAVGVLLLA
jgi:hypothetical protein